MNDRAASSGVQAGAPPPTVDTPEFWQDLPAGAAMLIDADGVVRACGPALPAFFSTGDGFLGLYVGRVSPAAMGDCLARLWCECKRTGEPATSEVVLSCDRRKEPDALSLSLRVSRHPRATSLHVVTFRDLSRERGHVQALLDHIDRLEGRARRAETAAATAAHDIRSGLAALRGFLDLATRGWEVPAAVLDNLRHAREIADRVEAVAERANTDGEERLCGAPVALGPLGHGLFRALQAAHPEVNFTWCVEAQDLRAAIDTDILWQILWNLLVNSVKYRRADRRLHVELISSLDQPEICIEVRDNGRGIPAGEEEAIFLRGCRGSNVGDCPGGGLGLSSAKYLVERQGGRIWAEPSYEGATLRLSLPAGVSRSSADPIPARPAR